MLYIAIGLLGAMMRTISISTPASCRPRLRKEIRKAQPAYAQSIHRRSLFSLFINAAILVLGAAAFHTRGLGEVADIAQAYNSSAPFKIGAGPCKPHLFACALLASGQNSTLTGTLRGRSSRKFSESAEAMVRRLITRAIAIIPAFSLSPSPGREAHRASHPQQVFLASIAVSP